LELVVARDGPAQKGPGKRLRRVSDPGADRARFPAAVEVARIWGGWQTIDVYYGFMTPVRRLRVGLSGRAQSDPPPATLHAPAQSIPSYPSRTAPDWGGCLGRTLSPFSRRSDAHERVTHFRRHSSDINFASSPIALAPICVTPRGAVAVPSRDVGATKVPTSSQVRRMTLQAPQLVQAASRVRHPITEMPTQLSYHRAVREREAHSP